MDSSSPPFAPTSASRVLLQPPRKWTSEHLNLANIEEHDGVSPEDLLGEVNIPKDGEEGFEKLSEYITKPPQDEIGMGPFMAWEYHENPFNKALSQLSHHVRGSSRGGTSKGWGIWALWFVFQALKSEVENQSHILFEEEVEISFSIRGINSRGRLKCDGVLIPTTDPTGSRLDIKQSMNSPLCLFTVTMDQESSKLLKHEVPQILLQAAMAFDADPKQNTYTGLAVTLHGPVLRLSKGVMSGRYMRDLCDGRLLGEKLKLYQSEAFDLSEREGRRHLLKLAIGLLRYLNRKDNM